MQLEQRVAHLAKIKLLILDVDGVLTDGKLYLSDTTIETKAFHVHDGLGLQMLLKNNIEIAIISGRNSPATAQRLHELGIKHLYLGAADKIPPFIALKKQLHLHNEEIAYMGDDLPDLPLMQQVGFSAAVANGVPKVRHQAHYVTTLPGGSGAVREVCDLILTAKLASPACE